MSNHAPQDYQSLLMHQEAVRLVELDPSLAQRALATLQRWMQAQGEAGTLPLWREWQQIISRGEWVRALEQSERGNELRQASPMATLLPEETRLRIIREVRTLKTEDPDDPKNCYARALASREESRRTGVSYSLEEVMERLRVMYQARVEALKAAKPKTNLEPGDRTTDKDSGHQ